MDSKRVLIIVCIILGILALLGGIWGYGLKGEKENLLLERDKLTADLSDVVSLKEDLEREVDSLEIAYDNLAAENDTLKSSVEDVQVKLTNTQAVLRRTRNLLDNEKKNSTGLRDQIQTLLSTKAELELNIKVLQSENDSLKARTGILEEDLDKARDENRALANLNQSMQEEVKKLTLSNFKASAFRVEVEKRTDKATAKSRRAKKVMVSFDLTQVPDEYQGVRPIYLTISDDKGTPIKMSNPIQAKVTVNGQTADIIAVEAKEINISANQRLSFQHDLSERLKRGFYRVAVYTDIGMLGATSFRLR